MYSTLRSSAYFLVRILRVFVPAPEATEEWDAEIPPFNNKASDSNQLLVSTWHWYVGGSYSSPSDLQNTVVTRIQWFKNTGALEHEFIVVTVKRQGGVEATLRIERRPSLDQVVTERFTVGSDVLDTLSAKQRKSLSQDVEEERAIIRRAIRMKVLKSHEKRLDVQAHDAVIHVRSETGQVVGWTEPTSLVASYSAFKKPLLLRDLVFAAYQASSYIDESLVLLKQSYWFPRTVTGVIVQNYLPQEIDRGEAFERRGCYCLKKDSARSDFALNVDNQEEINQISLRLVKDIDNNNKHINDKHMAGPGGRAAEKERADEEARRRIAAEHAASLAREGVSALTEQNRKLEEELNILKATVKD